MLTVTAQILSSLLPTDAKSVVPPGMRTVVDIQLFACLAEEAVSGLPTAEAAQEQIESMLKLGKK